MRPDGAEDPDRRAFLARTAALGLGLTFAGTVAGCGSTDAAAPVAASAPLPEPAPKPARRPASTARGTRRGQVDPGTRNGVAGGYGELVADRGSELALPTGFTYAVVAQAGVTDLEAGGKTPGRQDGSASFRSPDGGIVLVTNHEIAPGMSGDPVPVPALPLLTYDAGCPGGTTNVVLSADGERRREYVSLAGTDHNCAGGPTPWDTWLTCEETEKRRGQDGRKEDHGYVFEVDPHNPLANLNPRPIKALGRFKHEAVAIDPLRGHVYLTEDTKNPNGLFYRFTPPSPSRPLRRNALRKLAPDAGVLAAMQVLDDRGRAIPDLSIVRKVGASHRVAWVPVPERDAQQVPTRKQFAFGRRKLTDPIKMPITRARKLEGAWWAGGGAYFVSSYAVDADGAAHAGQVWFLDPKLGTVTLVLYYPPGRSRNSRVDGPDNIAGSPYGGVIIAEDGGGSQHLLGATATGETFSIARNLTRQAAGAYSEFTGPNFSPDRRTLFANIQVPGTVFAIRGPWREID